MTNWKRWIQDNDNINNGNDNNIFPKLAYLKVKCRTKYYKDIKDTITNTVYLWREERIIWRALWDDLLNEKERFICDFRNLLQHFISWICSWYYGVEIIAS